MTPLLLALAGLATLCGWVYQRRGSSIGIPLLAIGAMAGLAAIVTALLGSRPDLGHFETIAADFDHCQGLVLGKQLAATYAGGTILLLTTPDVGAREALMIQGLKEGLDGKLEITETRKPEVTKAYRDDLARRVKAGEYSEDMVPLMLSNYTLWFQAPAFAALMDALSGKVDVLVSTAAIPATNGRSNWPAIAVMNCPLMQHYKMINSGTIKMAVALKPDPASWQTPTSSSIDPRAQFDMRFLLLTPENVTGLSRQNPRLFEDHP